MAVFSSGGKYSFPQQSHYIVKIDFIIWMSSEIGFKAGITAFVQLILDIQK